MYRIALIRSASSALSKSQYNIQEIGMAKKIAECGLCVDVFLISDKDETYHEVISAANKVNVYWLKGFKIPGQQGYYPDLKKILYTKEYDLIQALDDSQITTVLVSSYCKKQDIKFVLWQGMYEEYPERYKKIIQWIFDRSLLRILRKNTKNCIAKTTSAKKYLETKKFQNISVIPVGLEISNFKKYKEINYRKQLNIPIINRIFLYVGKVEERRKPIFCMQLFSRIVSKNPESTLVYVGKGPMVEETKKYASDNNIPNVIFIDRIPQNELPPLYKCSDFFILPTKYEIFGMVLLESMYFGTPVITYKAAGPIDVISNGIDGIIMDDFDLEKWAKAIEKWFDISRDRVEMGNKAQSKIENNYMWEKIGQNYFRKFIEIIESNDKNL
ncbi:MAG: glycosyltransferase family 4 protein [Mobilitalea sp.]